MSQSTVILGLGELGRHVLDRVAQMLTERDAVRFLACPADEIAARLDPLLDELLRAGKASSGHPRLDVFAFADVLEIRGGELRRLCAEVAQLVGGRYAVLFPSGLPPEQRMAALHIVAVVPALTPSREAAEAMQRMTDLDQWMSAPGQYPLISRVWLVSRHTTAGTITEESLATSCAAFVSALVELRDEPRIAERVRHLPSTEGRIAFFSVASLDAPEGRIRRYAGARAAFDAVSTLVARVTRQVSDPALGDQAVAGLEYDRWLTAFDDGPSVERCRRLAASLGGAAESLPGDIVVGPFDDAQKIRRGYPILFRPATEERARTGVDSAELEEMLRGLDRTESDATMLIHGSMARLLETEVGKSTGLRRLPEVELGLRRIAAILRDGEAADARDLGAGMRPVEIDADPYRKELESAVADLPSAWPMRLQAAAFGIVVCAVVVVLGLHLGVEPPLPGAPPAEGLDWGQTIPWPLGLILGAAAAYLWARIVGSQVRQTARVLLARRRDALRDLWRGGGAGQARSQSDAQLFLRKRRVRRAALAAIDDALMHLGVVKSTLLDAHARATQELRDIGIKSPAATAAEDNLRPLVGGIDALHDILIDDTSLLSRWVASRRQVAVDEVWADRMVEGTWPVRGISEDTPCAEPAQIEQLCRWQTDPLAQTSILSDPEIVESAAAKVAVFVQQAAVSLAPPCRPRNATGDPSPGVRGGDMIGIAPQLARLHFEVVLGRSPVTVPMLWARSQTARVLFVRTWEGYTVDDVARGAGMSVVAQPSGQGGMR